MLDRNKISAVINLNAKYIFDAFCIFRSCLRKDLKLYKGHLSFLWTLTKAGKT